MYQYQRRRRNIAKLLIMQPDAVNIYEPRSIRVRHHRSDVVPPDGLGSRKHFDGDGRRCRTTDRYGKVSFLHIDAILLQNHTRLYRFFFSGKTADGDQFAVLGYETDGRAIRQFGVEYTGRHSIARRIDPVGL